MRLSAAALVIGCVAAPVPLLAQEVTGLLARGRTIAFPNALLPSLGPLASSEFRLAEDSAGVRRIGWSIGGVRDELDRVGTRVSVHAPAGRIVVHAALERAAVRELEEISNFERTGEHIAAHDGRLETGVVAPLTRGLWIATSVQYSESVLADRRNSFGELFVGAGWRQKSGFVAAVEAGTVTFTRASASEAERNPYGRLAVRTPPLLPGIRLVAGVTWNELGMHRARPVNAGAAVRWAGWRDRLAIAAGSEWGPTGMSDSGAELVLTASRIRVGTRATQQAPGTRGIQLWFGSSR